MSTGSTDHTTFTIERVLPAPLARVFDAWSNPDLKRAWFACHDDRESLDYQLDFRAGGRERNQVRDAEGVTHTFEGVYFDIVPRRRIIYAYDMRLGERRISV